MENKQPTVWTVLHDNDIVCDTNGMIPCFASREGIEFFVESMGMTDSAFKITEVSLGAVTLVPASPFRIN